MQFENTITKHKHKKRTIQFAIITVSDTRTLATDDAGLLIEELIKKKGHITINRVIVKDDIQVIQEAIKNQTKADAIITTGGTGLGKRDVTIEATNNLFEKELLAFNTLFTNLSYEEIGVTAIMSRATAGIYENKVIFCIPGSPKACKLAMEKIILKETNHIINHIRGDA